MHSAVPAVTCCPSLTEPSAQPELSSTDERRRARAGRGPAATTPQQELAAQAFPQTPTCALAHCLGQPCHPLKHAEGCAAPNCSTIMPAMEAAALQAAGRGCHQLPGSSVLWHPGAVVCHHRVPCSRLAAAILDPAAAQPALWQTQVAAGVGEVCAGLSDQGLPRTLREMRCCRGAVAGGAGALSWRLLQVHQ